MLGFIIALLMFGWDHFMKNVPMGVAFMSNVNWLNTWYWVWSSVIGVIIAIIAVGIQFGMAGVGSQLGRNPGGKLLGMLGGFALGSGLNILFIGSFLLRCGLLIGGTYLMLQSGHGQTHFSEFQNDKLIFGAILLFVGLLISKSSSSRSNN